MGPLNTRCRIILGTQKGTMILTTTHLGGGEEDLPKRSTCTHDISSTTQQGLSPEITASTSCCTDRHTMIQGTVCNKEGKRKTHTHTHKRLRGFSQPATPNYSLRHPKYHLKETIRPLTKVHLRGCGEIKTLLLQTPLGKPTPWRRGPRRLYDAAAGASITKIKPANLRLWRVVLHDGLLWMDTLTLQRVYSL